MRLRLLEWFSTILSIVALAGGGATIWATHNYRGRVMSGAASAGEALQDASGVLEGTLTDIDRVLELLPRIEATIGQTASMLGRGGEVLTGLRSGLARLAPALQAMATELRTLASSIGPMLGPTNQLRPTADQLDDAGTELGTTIVPIDALTADMQVTEQVVIDFRDRLRIVVSGMRFTPGALRDSASQLTEVSDVLASERVPQIIGYVGYAIGGILIFIGLSLLMMARTHAWMRRMREQA